MIKENEQPLIEEGVSVFVTELCDVTLDRYMEQFVEEHPSPSAIEDEARNLFHQLCLLQMSSCCMK